jgi:hypothetical protein
MEKARNFRTLSAVDQGGSVKAEETGSVGRTLMKRSRVRAIAAVVAFAALGMWSSRGAAAESPDVIAAEVDAALAARHGQPFSACDDATWLRRVALDLVGRQPTTEEMAAFAEGETSREELINRYLSDAAWAANWARYFRDVILYRRSDERAVVMARPLEVFFTAHLAGDARWDRIAAEMITAMGPAAEHGETAIIMAQMGETSDIAAEVSRIFMGIQIQCAQCHDHFTDRWKRTEFHEFAAFFPRSAIRRLPGAQGPLRFEVVSFDRARKNARPANNARAGELEHRMPDLDDPSLPGTVMQPVFFVTGEHLPLGTPDLDRRQAIADWITSADNPWFGRAIVNRIWTELVGTGFYAGIDDLGPDRQPSCPEAIDAISRGFVASEHDLRWLFRTILTSQAYASESRSRQAVATDTCAVSCPQPLRGDQLFTQLLAALDIDEVRAGAAVAARLARGAEATGGGDPQRMQQAARLAGRLPRQVFNATFGYDPSSPRDDIVASIPQVLLLMNGPQLDAAMDADRPATGLARLLEAVPQDAEAIRELYRRSLAREPSAAELETCLLHVRTAADRNEGFEDIQWALINSTEFVLRK